jgi:lipopolysaccharide export system permease protein
MRLTDRYILLEYVKSVLFCFVAFCLIYVLLDLFQYLSRFLEAQTPLPVVAYYYLVWVLPFLEYLFPAALLFAALYTLWRMARNNEITAMRACGIGIRRIMAPFLGVSMLFVVATIGIKEWAVPATRAWHGEFRRQRFRYPVDDTATIARDFIYHAPSARAIWSIRSFHPSRPSVLHGVKITLTRANRTREKEIHAAQAQWLDGQWWLFEARTQAYRDSPFHVPAGPPQALPEAGVPMRELATVRPSDIAIHARPWEALNTRDMLRRIALNPGMPEEELARRKTDVHFRLAIPWSCLVVALFGIPVGTRSSRQNILLCVVLALGCFFGFYGLLQLGVFLGGNGWLPPWLAAWFSNALFAMTGWLMIRKA